MTAQYLSDTLNLLSDDLLLEADRARLASAKKRHSLRNWSALVACLCILAVGAAVVIPRLSPAISQPEVKLHINKLNGVGVADIDLMIEHYDNLPDDAWQTVLADFHDYTGISYEEFTNRLPDSWQSTSLYSYLARSYKDGTFSAEYSLHDYIFALENETGGSATVAVCAFEMPLRDCFFVSENPKESTINGTHLVIHGGNGLYMARFFHAGLYYDIELSGVSKSELEEFLVALIVNK